MDSNNEVSFHLTLQQKQQTSSIYIVTNMEDVTAFIAPASTSNRTNSPINNWSNTDNAEVDAAAHLQHIQDTEIDNENLLLHRIDDINCALQKANHRQVIATAGYNGWLAAEMLGLPLCMKVNAFGSVIRTIKCLPKKINFTVSTGKCGPQPVYKTATTNYTISKTGWELSPFNPCYWTSNHINFNGLPHAYSDGDWQPIKFHSVSPQNTIHHQFNYVDDNAFVFSSNINPAYDITTLDHVNVVADLAAALNEHHQSLDEPGNGQKISSNIVINPTITRSLSLLKSLPTILLCVTFGLPTLTIFSIALCLCYKFKAAISQCFTKLPNCLKKRITSNTKNSTIEDIEAHNDHSTATPHLSPDLQPNNVHPTITNTIPTESTPDSPTSFPYIPPTNTIPNNFVPIHYIQFDHQQSNTYPSYPHFKDHDHIINQSPIAPPPVILQQNRFQSQMTNITPYDKQYPDLPLNIEVPKQFQFAHSFQVPDDLYSNTIITTK